MNKRTKGDAVRGDEVLGRTLSQTDNGPSPAEPSAGPPNRKVLRTLTLVVYLESPGSWPGQSWLPFRASFTAATARIESSDSAEESKAMIRPSLRRPAVGYSECAFARE